MIGYFLKKPIALIEIKEKAFKIVTHWVSSHWSKKWFKKFPLRIIRSRQIVFFACSLALFAIILSSCMVGPDFHSPPLPNTLSYEATKQPKKTVSIPGAGKAAKSQIFVVNKDISADWWRLFRSVSLNQLIEMGLKNSPNLTAAMAALRQAQENVNTQIGAQLFPSVSGAFQGTREVSSLSQFGLPNGLSANSIYNLFNASVNVSYTLDFFGGARRKIEALIATADYQQFQLMAAYLALTSNITTTAITIASLQAQIKATQQLILFSDKQLQVLRKQFYLGGIALLTVLTQETFVEQTKATLPPLEQLLAAAKHQLAALIGVFPDSKLPIIQLEKLTLPKDIPVTVPANLVRQRPDIRAAEALLHTASAQIGVATANLLPNITLSASYGFQSLIASQLFQKANNIWTATTSLAQPIFQGGSLLAARRAAIAGFDYALAQYRQAVLTGFQNTADSLHAIEMDARTLYAFKKAETAAYRSLHLTQEQFYLGGTTYLALLIAEQQFLPAKINRIRAQAARYTDTVALFQAIGGGWWHYPCAPSLGMDGWACEGKDP